MNLEPLVGAILGVSSLHENLGIAALAGGTLIIGGAVGDERTNHIKKALGFQHRDKGQQTTAD